VSSGIQFTGLASGLDTESIITQLMAVERQPRTRLTLRQAAAQAQEDSLNAIRTKLTALNLATTGLSSAALWEPTQSVDTTDATKVTARRTGGAGPGGYQVAVTNLAASEQRTFTLGATAAPSTLTLQGAWAGAPAIDVAVGAGATVDDVVAAVNAKSDAPVYAVNVNGSLVLSSKKTGKDYGFTVGGDTPLTGAGVKAGVDAAYTVDGVAKTSPTNIATDGIAGVELTLRSPTSSAVTVNVGTPAPDKAQTIDAVKAFVSAYNDVVTKVRAELTERRVTSPQTIADAQKGDLFGDPMFSSMLDGMRQAVSTAAVGGLTLADIGLSTGKATGAAASADSIDGKLTLDEAALSKALDDDPAAVQKLLGGMTDTRGFAQSFSDALGVGGNGFQSGGLLQSRIDAADSSVTLIKGQLDDMDRRLSMREDHLRKQFTALETALQRSQSQSADLASRLASLPGG
jgi:flagellar hook-associated protein 2